MISFSVLKKSKKSNARLGVLKTLHGEIETPAFVPVATQAVVKTLTSKEAAEIGSQLLIANTFHLHLKPGEQIVKKSGGLHNFMQWPKPLMTDSAGFQVFSLGFGSDHGASKMLKEKSAATIKSGSQPKKIRISENGVEFRSPIDGRKIFIGPKESIKIQEALGADIIFAFDECPPPMADYAYMKNSVARTHRWAKVCLAAKKSDQALYGIVQGGAYKDLRQESAKFIGALPFEGLGIGGEFGANKKAMQTMLRHVVKELPENKPRHLLGVGYLEDMAIMAKEGIDTFDCTVPTHYGRHGVAFTSAGKLDMRKIAMLNDRKPLDPKCDCEVCGTYSRSYLSHLLRAGEITGLRHLTFHNLHIFNKAAADLRRAIKENRI